ncbi:MAG: metallopeptidase TldD-related protein [Bryobacteraceae bacterium]
MIFASKVGEKIAVQTLNVVDDATTLGLFGSSPFDDEGVPSRRTPSLKTRTRNYLPIYTARKLGAKTTGNASRGFTGNASVGHGNLYIENGDASVDQIVGSVKNGFT